MPHTKTKEVYYFDELDDAAKEKAREWYRTADVGDTFWSEGVIEAVAHVAKILGFDVNQRQVKLMGGGTRYEPAIWWELGYSQSDGACFDATYRAKPDAGVKIHEYAPKDDDLHDIADMLADLGPDLSARIKGDERHHSHTVDASYDDEEDRPSPEEKLKQVCDLFGSWIYNNLRKEYEWAQADEQVDENIRVNEYEFTESGRRSCFWIGA
jgi:hypothetical protein